MRSSASAALVLAACAAGAHARSPDAAEDIVAKNLAVPVGTTLLQACTPTGPEMCFNAIDDNCNGVIDEGCGIQTGLLQFTIAWSAAATDVNLTVVTPDHQPISSERTGTLPNGFHLDRDCPGQDGCGGQNTENVYFDGPSPPHGHYLVEVTLADLHGADAPVKVRFGARLGARTVGFDIDLGPGDDAKKIFSFDLP
ncbi:MAG: hypothetical protein M3O36_02395 [Myxococcota bacterium]|nr:hypothetical protein [Myxococcota bacterium]